MSETFENGAQRSSKKMRYDLLFADMPDAIEGIARRATMGADKYGDHNWKSGGETFDRDIFNHLIQHEINYHRNFLDDEIAEIDHLEAVAWNAMAQLQKAWEKLRTGQQK